MNIWNCKNCQEIVEDDFEICWNCGCDCNGSLKGIGESPYEVDSDGRGTVFFKPDGNLKRWLFVAYGLAASIGLIIFANALSPQIATAPIPKSHHFRHDSDQRILVRYYDRTHGSNDRRDSIFFSHRCCVEENL